MNELPALISNSSRSDAQRELVKSEAVTAANGLVLSASQRAELAELRERTLESVGRVEFDASALGELARVFSGSPYVDAARWFETLGSLTEAFYELRSIASLEVTDSELIHMMSEEFDGRCGGSVDYLVTTVMPSRLRGDDSAAERETEEANE